MSLNREFREFLNAEEAPPPAAASRELLARIQGELEVHSPYLLAKLLLIHSAVALITLLFCPQFGVGPLGGAKGIGTFVMQWGPSVCAVICGAIFLGTSAIVASLALSLAELRALRKHLWAYYGGMAVLSAGILRGLGWLSESDPMHSSLPFMTIWLISAIFAAIGFTRLVSWQRKVG